MPENELNSENIRAFTFKEKRVETERSKKTESSVLGELDADIKALATFESYYTELISNDPGRVSIVRAKIQRRSGFSRRILGQVLINEFGEAILENFTEIPIKDVKIIPPEQASLLLRISDNLTESKKNREKLESTQSFISGVLRELRSGDSSREKIAEAKIQRRSGFSRRILGQVLINEFGEAVLENFAEIPIQEIPALTSDQKDLFLQIYSNEVLVKAKKEAALNGFKAFVSYRRDLASRNLEVAALARSKIKRKSVLIASERLPVLVDENGLVVLERLGRIPVDALPKISSDVQAILLEASDLITNVKIADELRAQLENYLITPDVTSLKRLRSVLVLEEDEELSKRIESFVSTFQVIDDRVNLERRFFALVLESDGFNKCLQVLGEFNAKSSQEVDLVAELRGLAFAVRRSEIIQSFESYLSRSPRSSETFNVALEMIDVLEKSADVLDRSAATILRKQVYELEIATLVDKVRRQISPLGDSTAVYSILDRFPIRPSVGEFDYLTTQVELRQETASAYLIFDRVQRLKKAVRIRASFSRADPDQVLENIDNLPDETEEEIAIKRELIQLYKSFVAVNRPDVFDEKFQRQIAEGIEAKLQLNFANPELGKNKQAFNYLRQNYVSVIFPLIESFKDDPRTKPSVEKLLTLNSSNERSGNPRLRFIQRLTALENQRPLTDTERAYIESVELLTLFNPYLVAAATAEPGTTSEFLNHHFDVLSKETTADLQDGTYFPAIFVGTGPDGLAAFGEVVRNNPALAAQSLWIDSGEQPGGPFAIPKGPAWELNSANKRGIGGYTMPDAPGENELKTVRAYGSPVARWYPGERPVGSVVRQGSINTTVDYFPTPDDLSTARYPTNEEMQRIIALQTAMLAKKLALRTELLSVEPNSITTEKGDKIATLRIVNQDRSERIVKVKTDAVSASTGLGEPTYGFKLEGSKAEKVIETAKDIQGFPKITTTLEAFREFAGRTKEKQSPGKTLIIWGKGNSADTLIEFIGNIFQSDNPSVRDVTKIYVICEGDLSSRPRYALINDLKPRNGRGNLIELVNARVADVDFVEAMGPVEKRRIAPLDESGQIILDTSGNPIVGDSGIAATGFRPQTDKVFAKYLNGGSVRDEGPNAPLKPISLPTNPNVAVAESFVADPNIILLGTASKPRFNSFEKLAQLPPEAREALLRNGAENAVAIGFRAPDTQAAIRIWLSERDINVEPTVEKKKQRVPALGNFINTSVERIPTTVERESLGIPNNVEQEDLLLSPLLAYLVGTNFELDSNFTGTTEFDLSYASTPKVFLFRFQGGEFEGPPINLSFSSATSDRRPLRGVSTELVQAISKAVSDDYFQRYALSLLGKRRKNPRLLLNISFKRGKIDPRNTFVQAV